MQSPSLSPPFNMKSSATNPPTVNLSLGPPLLSGPQINQKVAWKELNIILDSVACVDKLRIGAFKRFNRDRWRLGSI